MQNLAKVNEDMNLGLSQEEIRKILLCCSSRGDRISFNEFYQIMTRDNKEYLKGMGDTTNNNSEKDGMKSHPTTDAKTDEQPSALDQNGDNRDGTGLSETHHTRVTVEDGQMLNMPLEGDY